MTEIHIVRDSAQYYPTNSDGVAAYTDYEEATKHMDALNKAHDKRREVYEYHDGYAVVETVTLHERYEPRDDD